MLRHSLIPVPLSRVRTPCLFQHEREVRLVEELLSFHVRRARLLTDGIAVTRHAARGRERISALAVSFERGVRQKRRRRRAIHVWLFLEISCKRWRRRRADVVFLAFCANRVAWPHRSRDAASAPERRRCGNFSSRPAHRELSRTP